MIINFAAELRPCMWGDKRALLHSVGTKAWTHGAAITVGGFPAGQISYATAIIETECGDVLEVPVSEIKMLDSNGRFSEFSFGCDAS